MHLRLRLHIVVYMLTFNDVVCLRLPVAWLI